MVQGRGQLKDLLSSRPHPQEFVLVEEGHDHGWNGVSSCENGKYQHVETPHVNEKYSPPANDDIEQQGDKDPVQNVSTRVT
jgi:hypothetical protein